MSHWLCPCHSATHLLGSQSAHLSYPTVVPQGSVLVFEYSSEPRANKIYTWVLEFVM